MELEGDGGAGEGVCGKQTPSLLLLLIALLGCYQQAMLFAQKSEFSSFFDMR